MSIPFTPTTKTHDDQFLNNMAPTLHYPYDLILPEQIADDLTGLARKVKFAVSMPFNLVMSTSKKAVKYSLNVVLKSLVIYTQPSNSKKLELARLLDSAIGSPTFTNVNAVKEFFQQNRDIINNDQNYYNELQTLTKENATNFSQTLLGLKAELNSAITKETKDTDRGGEEKGNLAQLSENFWAYLFESFPLNKIENLVRKSPTLARVFAQYKSGQSWEKSQLVVQGRVLNKLLTAAIATTSDENIEAIKNFLENLGEEFISELGLRTLIETFQKELDVKNYQAEFIRAQTHLEIKLSQGGLITQAITEVTELAQTDTAVVLKSFFNFLESNFSIPFEVKSKIQTILAQLELRQITFKEAANQFAKLLDTLEFKIQGFNISKVVQEFLSKPDDEEEFFDAVEPPSDWDNESHKPLLTLGEFNAQIAQKKQTFIEKTYLYLVFTTCWNSLLDPRGEIFYKNALSSSLVVGEGTPIEKLKAILMGELQTASVFKRIKAHILWGLLNIIIPPLVANLCHHHIDSFFSKYISFDKTNEKNLFNDIVLNLNNFLAILYGAYERVANQTEMQGDIPHELKRELEKPCAYQGYSSRSFYAHIIRYEIETALGNSFIAKIISFIVGFPLGWVFAPKLKTLIERQVGIFINSSDGSSSGYPHGVNLVLVKQLTHLKNSLQTASTISDAETPSLSVQDKEKLQAFIKKFVDILSISESFHSKKELQEALKPENSTINRHLYKSAVEAITNFAGDFVQRLSKDNQMKHLMLELMENACEIYTPPETTQKLSQAAEVHRQVLKLIDEVTELSVDQFIHDLDLSGVQEEALVNNLINQIKTAIQKYVSKREEISKLDMTSCPLDKLQNLINETHKITSNLEKFPPQLKPEHVKIFSELNGEISKIKIKLMRHLEEMQSLMTKQKQFKTLIELKESLSSAHIAKKEREDSDTLTLSSLNLSDIQTQLQTDFYFFDFPTSLIPNYTELKKNCETLNGITKLLEDPTAQAQSIWEWLSNRSRILDIRQNTWLVKMKPSVEPTRMRRIGSILSSPFKSNISLSTDNEVANLKELKAEAESQKAIITASINSLRDSVISDIAKILKFIEDTKEKETAPSVDQFQKTRTELMKNMEDLERFNTQKIRPLTFYNKLIITDKQIKKITLFAVRNFGGGFISGCRKLLSQEFTYTHGILQHLLVPLLT